MGYVVNGVFRYDGGSPGPAPPAPPPAHDCQFFVAGACPGPADCMCTAGNKCGVGNASIPLNMSMYVDPKTGACNGRCRKVVHGDCPGSPSCLKDVGAC
jgi:hypothetical protein